MVQIYRVRNCFGGHYSYYEGTFPDMSLYSPELAEAFQLRLGITPPKQLEIMYEDEPNYILGEGASVYVMGCEGAVKIGFSENVYKRLKSLPDGYFPAPVDRIWISRQRGRKEAYAVEHLVHEAFSSKRIRSELFRVPFEKACQQVKKVGFKYDCAHTESVRQLSLPCVV